LAAKEFHIDAGRDFEANFDQSHLANCTVRAEVAVAVVMAGAKQGPRVFRKLERAQWLQVQTTIP
jgi:hypothetical protein